MNSDRPDRANDLDSPYAVWPWRRSYTDARVYHAASPREAAEMRARSDGEMGEWPRSYGVRDTITEEVLIIDVDMIQKPVFAACEAGTLSVKPAVHVLWNGRALCSIPGMPKDWPPGHRWISYKDVADGAEASADCCARCWDKARALIDHRQQIGSTKPAESRDDP
jgi:hypothetical protein